MKQLERNFKIINISGSILTSVGIGAFINVVMGFCALLILGAISYVVFKYMQFDDKIGRIEALLISYISLLIIFFPFFYFIEIKNADNVFMLLITIIGLALFLLPFTTKISEKYIGLIHLKYKRNVASIISNLLVIIGLLYIIFIHLPSNLLFTNQDEITISYKVLLKSLLPHAITILVIASLLLNLVPEKIYKIINRLLFSLNICIYLQYMFFNKRLTEIDGRVFDWKENGIFSYLNIAVWILVFLIPFLPIKRIKNNLNSLIIIVTSFLIFIQLANLTVMILNAPSKCFENKTYRYVTDTEFEMATDENIIVFVIDAVDNDYVFEIMDEEPEFFDDFNDFTLYDNTCSVYDYTHTSLNQMLTGYMYGDTQNYCDDYYDKIKEAGYKFECYGYSGYSGFPDITRYIDNYVALSLDDSDEVTIFYDRIYSDFISMSMYQVLPDISKNVIDADSLKFNNISVKAQDDDAHYENEDFNENMQLVVNSNISKKYTLYHIEGTHFPCEDYIETTKYCLNIAKNMNNQLKSLNLYDNSTIIIMSDHGLHDQADEYEWPTAATPMFLIKEKNRNANNLSVSDAPIYYTDYMATILVNMNLYDDDAKCKYGTSIYDYSQGDRRTRSWYDRFKDDDNKYRVYTYTGNYQDLKNAVANENYEDVYIY